VVRGILSMELEVEVAGRFDDVFRVAEVVLGSLERDVVRDVLEDGWAFGVVGF
jgi:hypothetical protein